MSAIVGGHIAKFQTGLDGRSIEHQGILHLGAAEKRHLWYQPGRIAKQSRVDLVNGTNLLRWDGRGTSLCGWSWLCLRLV